MKTSALFRHASLTGRILTNILTQLSLGLLLITLAPAVILWGLDFYHNNDPVHFYSLIISALTFITVTFILRRILRFPGEHSASYILPTLLITIAIAVAVVLVLRLPYSNIYLSISFLLSVIWFSAINFILRNWRCLKLALLPFGQASSLESSQVVEFLKIKAPELPTEHIDGIVADLHSDEISPEWEKFLAHSTLNRIPVYNIKQIHESITGKVRIRHLSENEFGSLLPSPYYQFIKRLTDIASALLLAPVALILVFVACMLVRRESAGNSIFIQERIGYRGKTFRMYKIRTMRTDITGDAVTASGEDPRVTPLGKVLRKYRIDELPQLLNILKGDMSLIGPRPGPVDLEAWYEEKVPFFAYRHVVRPGITGWAQVMQGYAESADEMNEKLEYDFYYIKHFSLWLDVLIVYKTIKTILTGFGSR